MPTPKPLQLALLRLRAIFVRHTVESDMQAEMREHLDRATERYVARGMSPADARLAARQEFGNLTVHQEDSRDARGSRWVEALGGDMHFALRYFARHRATTAIIVTVLALGTGANAMIFSTFQAQFLRPAPAVPSDATQARIWSQERPTKTSSWQERRFTLPELTQLSARREVFRDVAAWTEDELVLESGDSTGARSVNAQFVTPNFFSTLGVGLAAGQGFLQQNDGAPDFTAVLSYAVAEQSYGSAAAAIGKRIVVNELPLSIVGVTPPDFQGAVRNMGRPSLWIPMSARAAIAHVPARWATDEGGLSLFARLASGVSHEQATAFARQVVANALPDSASRVGMSRGADVLAMRAPPPGGSDEVVAFTMMMVIGILILLVAWMNVSSLMVAAAVTRRHEIAVRLSLGASRVRLLRQLVTESTMLALTGGALGLTLAWWGLTIMSKSQSDGLDLMPDAWTFLFVLAVAVISGVLFGLSPALHATRGDVSNALRDSGTGVSSRSRMQRGFVVAQIALSQPLLVFLATLLSLVVSDYRPLAPEMSRHVIAATFHPLERGAPGQAESAVDQLIPRIAERPEVAGAVHDATGFAVRGAYSLDRVGRDAKSDTVPTILHIEGAAPGWLSLVDVPVILGRDVALGDTSATDYPIVIGSELARTLWGAGNPIGRTLVSPSLPGLKQDSIAMTVVGVYDGTKRLPGMAWQGEDTRGGMSANITRVYTARGKKWRHDQVLVRTRGPAEPFLSQLQQLVRSAAPSLPVTSMLTLEQADHREYVATLRETALAVAGGAMALLLASLGLYGVVSLAVKQRTREIGIRIAVGAEPLTVARMLLASGVRVSVIALALGLPLSIVGLRMAIAQGLIIAPGVNPYLVGLGIGLVLIAVASMATWLPARRAAEVDPARTLRVE